MGNNINIEGNYDGSREIESHLSTMSLIDSILLEEELKSTAEEENAESKAIQAYLDAAIGSEKETEIKRIIIAAAIKSNQEGTLPFEASDHTVERIVAIIDSGLKRAKLAYLTGKGELEPLEAIDALIDSYAARMETFVPLAIAKGLPILIDRVCDSIDVAYPPAKAFTPIIRVVTKKVAKHVANYVQKGIRVIAQKAKDGIKAAVQVGKAWVAEKAKKLFNVSSTNYN